MRALLDPEPLGGTAFDGRANNTLACLQLPVQPAFHSALQAACGAVMAM